MNGVGIQDIFDYLSYWLATPSDPRAEFDGMPGITLNDLFTFLQAWFNGCGQAPMGVCCRGATCTIETGISCTGFGTLFVPTSMTCNVLGTNNTAPCCLGDFNHDGVLTVQDILDYITAYFTSDPTTDINGGGSGIQDIFDFLAVHFAGGC